MARKAAQKPALTESQQKTVDLLARIHERFQIMEDADHENRRQALDDMKFVNVPGNQWDPNMMKARDQRPCYEFNKIRISGKRVINEIRANRPQGKVRAVEDSDKDKAEMLEGLCRNIWNNSDGDTIVDYAAEYQVNGGMGAWRITTEYASDDAFDQDIVIEGLKNPFCLYCDPAAKDQLKRDAEDWILTDRITRKSYEAKWPDKEVVDFELSQFDRYSGNWMDKDTVRVAEYWYKEPYEREIWLLADGRTVDANDPSAAGIPAVRKRKFICERIMMCIASGEAILEGPTEFAGPEFPFVMIFGESVVIDGKDYWWGLPRFGKDAQRSYNIAATATIETIAQAPKSYAWVTPTQIEGLGERIMEAHQKNFPVMPYNPDPMAPGPPVRVGGADVPVALLKQMEVATEDIRETLGIYEASFGQESNEKSGIALRAKQSQAELVTYNYPDNVAKGIQRTWEILIGLIPKVYDSQRTLRILGTDGAEDYVTVNQKAIDQQGNATVLNDLTVGKYDVIVTVGPGYATKRLEAADTYMQLAQANPAILGVAGDLIVKSLDVPYSEDISDRLRTMLPPQIQQMISKDKPIPPEVQAAMAQANAAMQQVQQQGQLVQQAAQEANQEKAAADKAKSDVQIATAQLKAQASDFAAQQANAEAALAKQLAALAGRQADLDAKEAQLNSAQAVAEMQTGELTEAHKAVQGIGDIIGQFMQGAGQMLDELKSQRGMVIAMPKKSRVKGVRTVRQNGSLVSIPEYDGPSDEPRIAQVRTVRGPDGSLVGIPEYEDQVNGAPNSVPPQQVGG